MRMVVSAFALTTVSSDNLTWREYKGVTRV
jgi:hypothetical protein